LANWLAPGINFQMQPVSEGGISASARTRSMSSLAGIPAIAALFGALFLLARDTSALKREPRGGPFHFDGTASGGRGSILIYIDTDS
jgi:hypothetical protein